MGQRSERERKEKRGCRCLLLQPHPQKEEIRGEAMRTAAVKETGQVHQPNGREAIRREMGALFLSEI